MSLDPRSVELWLFSQLGLFFIWLLKEFFRIFRDQSRKNSTDIGALLTKTAKLESDMNALWQRQRLLEKSPAKDDSRIDGT